MRRRKIWPATVKWRGRGVLDAELYRLGVVNAGNFGHHGEREVDTGGNASAGKNIAIPHHARWIRDRAECR
jgi:hypothetical protein